MRQLGWYKVVEGRSVRNFAMRRRSLRLQTTPVIRHLQAELISLTEFEKLMGKKVFKQP
jgi:hypothetical protein